MLYHVHLTRVSQKSVFAPSVCLRVWLTNRSHQECLSEQMCWHSCAASCLFGTQRSIFATAGKVMFMVRQFGISFQCDPNCEAWSLERLCLQVQLGLLSSATVKAYPITFFPALPSQRHQFLLVLTQCYFGACFMFVVQQEFRA